MKRFLSLILVSIMLISTVFLCKVDVNAEKVDKLPFYLSNWETVDSEEYPNLWSKPYLWATRNGDTVTVSYGGSTIPEIAAKLKETFDKYPEGIRIPNYAVVMRRHLIEMAEDVVFMDNAAEKLRAWTDELLAECKRIGVKLDGLYSDLEYIDGYYWYLYQRQFQAGNTDVYYNIINHPSYQTRLRPMLEERGFQFYPKPLDSMPEAVKKTYCELYSLHPSSGDKYAQSRHIWDVVVQNMWNQYMNESVFEPLQKHYPDAIFMDYKNLDGYGWMKDTNENNSSVYLGGNTIKVGTHNANNMYNYAPQFVTQTDSNTTYIKPVSHIDAVYEDGGFHNALWEINAFKNMMAASEDNKLYVDATSYDYGLHYGSFKEEPSGTAAGTPYHTEEYYHLGLMNVILGGYFIESEAENASEHDYKLQVVSEILNELTRVAGYADRKAIEVPSNWNDDFILSGMYANGRNIWRITPDTAAGVTKKSFLVKNDGEVVFKVNGQTITFPQGTIIEDTFIPAVGTCGYWVETPAGVMPTVTYDKDRFEKNPAYAEAFDNYETGIDFNYKNAQYTHTWEVFAWEGASATIAEANGKDKALALTGSVFLSNVKLPEYITAGDDYAKQQVWQTAFSLSALPTGDAEAKLLNATSGSGTSADGGFRIFDGKLYYGKVGEYQAFENVTLAANTEYTVKRVLDFRTEGAFTSSYYVYDASGNLLDKAENVAVDTMTLPVQKIGLSTQSFGNNTLYVDDYKLYATGLGYTFEVYNAATGIELKDPTAAQNFDVAYRFSWMNASGTTQSYNVVATYSDGAKQVVKTVTMAPGAAAVDTGIVKADGKSVTLSVEALATTDDDTNTGAPDGGSSDGGTSDGSSGKKGLSNAVLLVVLLCLAVVLIGLVIAVLLIPGKIKTETAPNQDEDDAQAQTE